jgi:hypothetical protein
MSSVVRSFTQRKTNVETVIPVYQTTGTWNAHNKLTVDPRYASVFNVDLSGVRARTATISNRVDVQGNFGTYTSVPIVYTYLDINPHIVTSYPGLEFTVNFNWSKGVNYYTYVDVYVNPNKEEADVLSPGAAFNLFYTVSITVRSNGKRWVVIGSGPTSWSGGYDY